MFLLSYSPIYKRNGPMVCGLPHLSRALSGALLVGYLHVGGRGLCLPAPCRRHWWEQEKPEASLSRRVRPGKLDVNRAESPASGALSPRSSGTLCWAVFLFHHLFHVRDIVLVTIPFQLKVENIMSNRSRDWPAKFVNHVMPHII